MKILIVEDEKSLSSLLSETMRKDGYVVETATDYASASEKIELYSYDCILLDLMLPGGDGLDLLRMAKSKSPGVNVIITSARDSVDDKVAGLETGADDYLPKPFHLAELSARVRSVTRRSRDGETSLKFANVELEPETHRVFVDGKEIELLKKEFSILSYFMHRPGRLVDKADLAEAVWGDHIDQADDFQFLYAQVKNLRKKMQEAGSSAELKAVYGFGYKLVAK